ncbi:Thioesterase/thiol ester dehydrase-isomerase [Coemansia reversa NRRL 1564]|uniref:Thioesterase/thiol ester dehydrase-isomerase n=1 Tax=Coemansia reversa (strain ATCC 12441 / NRRL 1564) TaxID=763665 RepID=A0A2G5BIJ8_COERN|nr:Thioesterase/thiol ester dehydrase-isomerase [Coemansia reversa NRRL 1564]|eukprot:PIA18854.1 Thioesterase/thiol ester dehydrase-isomerase [Coemansia reversa NRRL 1564]
MAATGATTLNHIRHLMSVISERKGFDALCFGKMKLLSAETGRVRGEVEVTRDYLNAIGGTHGGWLSTLVDVGGSLAIASHGFETTGVSTDLSVSFLAPSGEGSNIIFDAQVLKLGRTLAYTRVDIFSGEKMVATGSHTKYVAREQERAAAAAK